MADNASFDFSDLTKLAADIERAPKAARAGIRKAAEVTSRKVKDAWNEKLYTDGAAKLTGHSVTYDVLSDNSSTAAVSAEIGPVRGGGKQAGVVLLLEFGKPGQPPHGYGAAALEENAADFEYGISKAIDDSLKGFGL